ncbi:MAG: hypothetical protein ACJ79S_09385 [Gemmatimonadaceae bacterium]
MSSDMQHAPVSEPVGIVISNGAREIETPRFWAYVWAPAPQGADEAPSKVAA